MGLILDAPQAKAALIIVDTAGELEDALSNPQPGDTIEVLDGVYDTGGSISIRNSGLPGQPIIIRARNIGSAELTGDTYFSFRQCAWVIIEGFLFTTLDNTAIKLEACNNIRITRNTFRLQETESLKWVIVQGIWNDPNALSHHNRIDHNLFENKTMAGNCITIDGTPDPTYLSSQYDRIDHNHFRNIGPRRVNEMETIRIGWSELSTSSGFTVVEFNLFEDCDGDPEIISVKTNDDTLRHNTFRRSQGTLSLRHGNRSVVDGNYFFGEGKSGTGGVRLYGDDHQITNNYFEGLTGTRWDAPITLTNGDYDGGGNLTRHFRINRALISHNTLVNNAHHIEIGFTNNGNYTRPPRDVVVSGNLIWGKENDLVDIITDPVNITWQHNIMFPDSAASLGISVADSQISVVDPFLERVDGIYRLTSESPAIDTWPALATTPLNDIDGQLRNEFPDVGADEYISGPILFAPLDSADVGPFAGDIITGLDDRPSASVPAAFTVLQNYPNPFNPQTTISYQLQIAARVGLQVFDIGGRLIDEVGAEDKTAGEHHIVWNAAEVGSGVYFYRLTVDQHTSKTRKMVVLK